MILKKTKSYLKKAKDIFLDFWFCIKNTRIRKDSFLIWCIFFLSISDAILTLGWIKAGLATEANPFLVPLLAMGDCAFLAVKILLTGAACIILYFNKHRPLGKIIITAVSTIYCLLTAYHFLGFWAAAHPDDIPWFIENIIIWLSHL